MTNWILLLAASTDNESAAGGEELDKGGDIGNCALCAEWSGSYRRWKAFASTSTWRLGRKGRRQVDQPQRWALNPAKHPTTTTTTTITTTIILCVEGNFKFFLHVYFTVTLCLFVSLFYYFLPFTIRSRVVFYETLVSFTSNLFLLFVRFFLLFVTNENCFKLRLIIRRNISEVVRKRLIHSYKFTYKRSSRISVLLSDFIHASFFAIFSLIH